MFFKIDVLKNFAILTEKSPVPEFLFNKVAGVLRHRYFPEA